MHGVVSSRVHTLQTLECGPAHALWGQFKKVFDLADQSFLLMIYVVHHLIICSAKGPCWQNFIVTVGSAP